VGCALDINYSACCDWISVVGVVMKELAHKKLEDGRTVTISKEDFVYVVACYSRGDMEEWRQEYDSEDEAWWVYKKANAF
jgi:hypothetical protein